MRNGPRKSLLDRLGRKAGRGAGPRQLTGDKRCKDNPGNAAMATPPPLNPAELSAQAESLLKKANEYRATMDALDANDPRRSEYEQLIREMLKTVRSLSTAAATSAKAS